MVKIDEFQYQLERPYGSQSRIIEYSSWGKYLEDIQTIDGTINELIRPSLPRQTEVIKETVRLPYNAISFRFYHRVLNLLVCHTAVLKREDY